MGPRFHNLHRTVRARLAVTLAVVLALTLYGVLAGGGKGASPLSMKPTAASNAGFAVTEVLDGNGNIDIAAQGPNHSLLAYWEIGAQWFGPVAVNGTGTTFSAPSMLIDRNGNLDLAVQGPNNQLWVYWNIGGVWNGPLGIGGSGTAFSSPATTVESNGTVDVAVQGPGNSLLNFWEVNAQWFGPFGVAGPGTTFSTPSMTSGSSSGHNFLNVTAQGPNNDPRAYEAEDGTWRLPQISGPGEEFSAPSTLAFFSAGSYASWFEGPNNSLVLIFGFAQGGTNSYCIVGQPGEALSAPNINNSDGTLPYVGPGNTLRIRWYGGTPAPQPNELCDNLSNPNGPLGIGGTNTAFSVPAIVTDANGHDNIAVQGPNNSLWLFFDIGGTWMGPIGVGGPGSTFSSPN